MSTTQRLAARHWQSARARQADKTTNFATILRHQLIGDNAAHNLVIAESAFRDLIEGSTDPEIFGRLAMAINCALVRSEAIDPLLEQTMQAAVAAMVETMGIFERHGRYGFTGPGLAAVKLGLEAYADIARHSTPVQMQTALNEVMRRYRDQQAAS